MDKPLRRREVSLFCKDDSGKGEIYELNFAAGRSSAIASKTRTLEKQEMRIPFFSAIVQLCDCIRTN